MIRLAVATDAKSISDIYNYYVQHSVATFAEELVSIDEMVDIIQSSIRFYVVEEQGVVLGYAYGVPWRKRTAYRFTVEVSIYLDPSNIGNNYGTKLYEVLFRELRALDIHLVIGGMTLPNIASQYLHEKFGFKKIAHFSEVGYKFDQWLDVGYWELRLNE